MFYAASSTCWLRSTSVWLECTSAKQSAVCFEPMGTSPSPFSIRVPCSHSLCRMFTLRRGFLSCFAYCAACRMAILHGCRVHVSLLGFGVVRLLIRIRCAGCFLYLEVTGAFCAQSEVCRYRGDQLVARQLLMRFRCGVSIAPVLSDICSADLGDSAPPLVALISAREAHIGAGRCLVHEPQALLEETRPTGLPVGHGRRASARRPRHGQVGKQDVPHIPG